MKTTLKCIIVIAVSLSSCYRSGEDTGVNPYGNGYGRLPNSIRLATYNVRHCTPPLAPGPDYDLTASVISAIAPDVMALQELDSMTVRSPHYQLGELALRSGLEHTFGYTIYFDGGKYGNGILSREKPLAVYNEDLIISEPRKFLAVEFRDYIFIATHFDDRDQRYRMSSVTQINSWVSENFRDCAKPIFLAGDINDPDMKSQVYGLLLEKWEIISVRGQATYIGQSPGVCIDYIMRWKDGGRVQVIGTAVPKYEGVDIRKVSDHLPVITDIKMLP